MLTVNSNDEYDGQVTLVVQHSLDSDPEARFVSRGTITVRSIRAGMAAFNADGPLSSEDRIKLKELVQLDRPYRLRVSTKLGNDQSRYVSTFIKACSLYESHLSDIIVLHMDQAGEVLGVSVRTQNMLCEGINVPDSQLVSFNTSVIVNQMENGPVPDTASYVQKMEKEKAEKAKGEQSDNRGFFAKYWMYIVPIFIFVLISGAANPEAQGGGR